MVSFIACLSIKIRRLLLILNLSHHKHTKHTKTIAQSSYKCWPTTILEYLTEKNPQLIQCFSFLSYMYYMSLDIILFFPLQLLRLIGFSLLMYGL